MKFHVNIEKTVELELDEIWPDDDIPANPTCEQVAERIAAEGSLSKWLSEWSIEPELEVWVTTDENENPVWVRF